MPPADDRSLWRRVGAAGWLTERALRSADGDVMLETLAHRSSLGGALERLRGRSVLIATRDQLPAALALIELDGVARRLVLATPDLPAEHLAFAPRSRRW